MTSCIFHIKGTWSICTRDRDTEGVGGLLGTSAQEVVILCLTLIDGEDANLKNNEPANITME